MLNKITIQKQIVLLCIVVFFALSISGTLTFISSKTVEKNIDHLNVKFEKLEDFYLKLSILSKNIKFNTVQVQQWLTDISATRGLNGLNDGFDVAEEFSVKFKEDIIKAKKIISGSEQEMVFLPLLNKMETAFPPYYETGKRMAKAYISQGPQGGNILMGSFDKVAENIGALTNEFMKISEEGLKKEQSDVNILLHNVKEKSHIFMLLILILAGIIILIITAISIYIYTSLNTVITSFKITVDEVIQGFSSAANQLTHTSEDMSNNIHNVEEQTSNVANLSNTMQENINSVAASGEELSSTATQINNQLSQSLEIVKNAVQEVNKADEISQELNTSTASIGGLVNLIKDIAEQTNLLALNAAIESARAGDAGRGFAVVADEVKKLSNQTGDATTQIATQIATIQNISQQVVSTLSTIQTAITSVEEGTTHMGRAVQEQNTATRDIAESMNTAANNTNEITQNIITVETEINTAQESSAEVDKASHSLLEKANILNQEVKKFLKILK